MKNQTTTLQIEPRWPAALTIVVLLVLMTVLPNRIRFVPVWVPYAFGISLLVSMATVPLTGAKAQWLRFEHIVMLVFCAVAGVGGVVALTYLIREMVYRSTELSGLQLLASSIVIWVTNVIIFTLLYWQIDRGGPEARMNNGRFCPDWRFTQAEASEDVPLNWRPTFVDYLFLAFTTATAFSPTDTLPLTSRAKLLMMLESSIALTTTVVVASRAINILGS